MTNKKPIKISIFLSLYEDQTTNDKYFTWHKTNHIGSMQYIQQNHGESQFIGNSLSFYDWVGCKDESMRMLLHPLSLSTFPLERSIVDYEELHQSKIQKKEKRKKS